MQIILTEAEYNELKHRAETPLTTEENRTLIVKAIDRYFQTVAKIINQDGVFRYNGQNELSKAALDVIEAIGVTPEEFLARLEK